MESYNQVQATPDDEVSLKDIILKIQDWGKYLISKWLFVLLFGLLGAAIGLTYAFFIAKPRYVAELTFVLEDSKSGSLGGYAGLASQFGLDLGSASGSGIFTGDNIMEFFRSRLMVEKTLLSPITVNGKAESLANYYIEINELKKKWEDKPLLKAINFPADPDRKTFSLQQDSILSFIYNSIIKENLTVIKPDKKLSFISVKCVSKDEIFSKYFTERIVKEATQFYVQTKTQRYQQNVEKLQVKADSLELLLNRKTFSAAASQDLNLNPARNVAGVSTELAMRDKMVLQTMYGEIVKNLEMSRMSMAQETPIIQIIDTPIFPLKKEKFGNLKGIVYGGFLGGFLFIICLFIQRIYKEIMTSK